MADSSPTMRRRQLGAELRRWRTTRGKDLADAAGWIGIDESGMSRIETGKRTINVGNVRTLLDLYDVPSPDADALLALAKDAQLRSWFAEYGSTVPKQFQRYLGMEDAAQEIRSFEGNYPPGLLQTRGYLNACASANQWITAEQVERLNEIREVRKLRLTSDQPLTAWFILDESVLRRRVGTSEVMRGQLRELRDAAGLDNVTLQVMPFAAGAHGAMANSFTLLRFPQETMTTVYIELERAALYLEKPAEVARYAATFESLARSALGREETLDLLTTIERELD